MGAFMTLQPEIATTSKKVFSNLLLMSDVGRSCVLSSQIIHLESEYLP